MACSRRLLDGVSGKVGRDVRRFVDFKIPIAVANGEAHVFAPGGSSNASPPCGLRGASPPTAFFDRRRAGKRRTDTEAFRRVGRPRPARE